MTHLLHGFRTPIVLFIGLLAAAAYSPQTFGALAAYEGFDYPNGSDLNDANGGIGWATPWAHTDNAGVAVAAGVQSAVTGSLTYTDAAGRKLVTSGNKAVFNGSNAVNSQIGRNMSTRRSTDATTTWVSFIGQRRGEKSGTAGPDGGPSYERGVNLTLWDTTLAADATAQRIGIGENSGVLAGQSNDTWGISAQGAGSQRRQTTNDFDKVTFVVLRIDHKGDETVPDDVYFWVNPLLGAAPNIAGASTNILSTETPPVGYTYDYSFDRIRQFAGNLSGTQAFGEWYFDEFRVGDSYTEVAPIDSPLIAYEGFDYPADDDLTGKDGGFGWTSPWGANVGGISDPTGNVVGDTAGAGGFNYTDAKGNKLVTTGGHGVYSGEPGTSQPFRDFAGRGDDNTTTWISFIGVRQGPTNDTENPYPRGCNIAFFEGGAERFAFGNASGAPTNAWSILNGGGAVANLRQSTRPFERQSFIVVRVDHKTDNDETYLFLDPALDTEPNTNNAAAVTLGEFSHTFNRVRPFAGNTDTGNNRPYAQIALDEIRVGTTYAAVTPFTPGGGGARPTISISRNAAGAPVITYTGTLVSAATVTSPYQPVTGASSPFAPPNVAQGTTVFYQSRN